MSYMLEIQLENLNHRLMMESPEEAKYWLDKLAPYVGVPRFSRNADTAESIRIPSLEGEIVISLERLVSVRTVDSKVFHDANAEDRIADRTEFANIFRKVDSEIWERILKEGIKYT